jgi:predicted N-acetyltransferase YhbS
MVRKITKDDIPAIKKLIQSEPGFWRQDTRPDVLKIELGSAKDLSFVWVQGGEIIGLACAHDLGFRAYLSELIVAKHARGKGIDRILNFNQLGD